jgi:hypothetical protein
MSSGRLFGFGAFVSSAWLMAAPVPGGCGGVGGGTGGGTSTSVCGNGVVEGLEDCDNRNMEVSCREFGAYTDGVVQCNPSTCRYDFDWCSPNSCGNGRIEWSEACDAQTFVYSDRCEDLNAGFVSGRVRCAADCTIDSSLCQRPQCGNRVVEYLEDCDGTNLGGATTCDDVGGYFDGPIRCGADCKYDTSACRVSTCGNGVIEGAEVCEGSDFGSAPRQECSESVCGYSVLGLPVQCLPGPVPCGDFCQPDVFKCRRAPGCYRRYAAGPLPTNPTLPWTIECVL